MSFPRSKLRNIFLLCAVVASAIVLASCGNSCVVGTANNGNGSIGVKLGNQSPSCPLTPTPVFASVVVVKAPKCQQCAPGAPMKNAFVTVRGVQLHSNGWNGTDSDEWVEIATKLESKPRPIDLISDSVDELVAENVPVPVGVYTEVRLQLLGDSPAVADELPVENACGRSRSNCVVMADGHTEPLRSLGDTHEMLIPIQSAEGNSAVFLPGSRIELRLALEPRQALTSSGAEGLRLRSVLTGRAVATRRSTIDDIAAVSQ